jgi:hypothetical protein
MPYARLGTCARYQRLLHRNLMEMANFIDSCFGVYTKSEDGDDTSSLVRVLRLQRFLC